jgi:uncharacterized protein YuzE
MKALELEVAKRIRYSSGSDVLYFLFAEGEEDHFEEPIPGVHVEYDDTGNVIGVEILRASEILGNFVKQVSKRTA